jgi:tRNA pseudouridine55 synthase
MTHHTINLYKPRSITPLQAIRQLKEQLRQKKPELAEKKMAYAGRLDPMAHGVLLILVGKECKKQVKYQNLAKSYEFAVAFGVSTDTYDRLGIVEAVKIPPKLDEKRIEALAEHFVGEYELYYPPYSSKPVDGKPLFYWAKKGEIDQIQLPPKQYVVKELEFMGLRQIELRNFIKNSLKQVDKVEGDFRQKLIMKRWREVLDESSEEINREENVSMQNSPNQYDNPSLSSNRQLANNSSLSNNPKISRNPNLPNSLNVPNTPTSSHIQKVNTQHLQNKYTSHLQIARFRAIVGSGTYIRVIANEMGKKLGIPSIASDIQRIRVGDFRIEESKKLDFS